MRSAEDLLGAVPGKGLREATRALLDELAKGNPQSASEAWSQVERLLEAYHAGWGTEDALSFDAVVAQNLHEARNRKGLSQRALAEALRQRGFDTWHDTTVTYSEAARPTAQSAGGKRPQTRRLLLEEAVALADVLQTSVEALVESSVPVEVGSERHAPSYLKSLIAE